MSRVAHAPRTRTISRRQAAEYLHRARVALRDDPANADQAIGWAMTVLRHNRHARRLKIDFNLQTGNYESADALLARTLLCEPERPSMRRRYAQSLLMQGRVAQAWTEIQCVLASRPGSIASIRLAGEIASAMEKHARAVEILKPIAERPGASRELRIQYGEALLACGDIRNAAAICHKLLGGSPVFEARICLAQHQLLEARCIIESGDRTTQREAVNGMQERVFCLAEFGDPQALRHETQLLAQSGATAAFEAVAALLERGCFDSAHQAIAQLQSIPALRERAIRYKACVDAIRGQPADPELMMHQSARPGSTDGERNQAWRENAQLWLKAIMGSMIQEQTNPKHAGADPNVSMLQPMLERALVVLRKALATAESQERASRLAQLCAICLQALGRTDEIPAVLYGGERVQDCPSTTAEDAMHLRLAA